MNANTYSQFAARGIHASPEEPKQRTDMNKSYKGVTNNYFLMRHRYPKSGIRVDGGGNIYDDKGVGNYRDRRLEAMGRMEGRERLIVSERMSGRTQRRKQIKRKEKQNKERRTTNVVQVAAAPRDSEINFVDEDRSLFMQGSLYYLHSFEHLLFFKPPPDYLHA